MLEPTAGTAAGVFLDEAAETAAATNEALLLAAETAEPDAAEPETPATDAPAEEASTKPETGKDDATVEGNGDGNGQVPPGQTEDEDGTIVNPGGNVAPGLNRGEHIDKPENPNKPDKPENPGTEDSTDSKVNKANSGTHIYTYDELNRMVTSQIAKELTNYTYDSLGNLVLETVKNKSVDYEYNELNQLVRKTTSTNDTYTYSYDKRGNCAGAERRLRRMQRGGGGAKKGAGKPPSARRRTRLFLASGLPRPAKRRPSPSCTTPLTAWWKARTGRAIPRPTPTTVWACG